MLITTGQIARGIERLSFSKMHGAGNDFVILDLRRYPNPTPELCSALADRHKGVGCDLILGVGSPIREGSVASYLIWTKDGQPSAQCGNGARCVAAWAVRENLTRDAAFVLDSPSGPIVVNHLDAGLFRVAFTAPRFGWDTASAGGSPVLINLGPNEDESYLCHPVAFGNSHAVILVDDVDEAPVVLAGQAIQSADAVPRDVNVGFAQIISRKRIRLRVFEFGAGETLACGTGACAAAAVLIRQGQVDRSVVVSLGGGDLTINWPSDEQQILMDGPAQFTFKGEFYNAFA